MRPLVWMWYFSFWMRSLAPYFLLHRDRPDAPRDATDHGVLGVHAVAEEEATGWARSRRRACRARGSLDEGEAVGQRERELTDRVRARLGDVIAADRHRVEVAHPWWTKYCAMSPITLRENSVEKMQVFWPWSSFRMSACTVPRTFCLTQAAIFCASSSVGSRPLSALNLVVCWSIAVFMNIARIVGAGPLIVIETDVLGRTGRTPSTALSDRRASRSRRRNCRPCHRCRGAGRGRCRTA